MTIDIKDLKIGDNVLVKARVLDLSNGEITLRFSDLSSFRTYCSDADIHSILPREPQIGEVWLNKKQHVALKILHLERHEFAGKYANCCLCIDYLTDFNERYTFIPPEQHKEYGFE